MGKFLIKILKPIFSIIPLIYKKKIINILNTSNLLTFDKIIFDKVNVSEPTIFDVGGNKGQSIDRFLKIFPNAYIHTFEPTQKACKIIKLKNKNKKNIIINNFALGNKNEIKKFYINNNNGSSSFFELNKDQLSYKNIVNKEITDVQIHTLDEYVEKNNIQKIDYLKIDTQGYESLVLEGAKKCLQKKLILLIELEIILVNLYMETFNFYQIEKILLPFNYHLIDIKGIYYDNCGYLKHLDALYVSKI